MLLALSSCYFLIPSFGIQIIFFFQQQEMIIHTYSVINTEQM